MTAVSLELAKTNPYITFSDMGMGFKSRCKLIEPTKNNKLGSCPEISTNKINASNNKGIWTIEGIKPPIISCAECPIARKQTQKK